MSDSSSASSSASSSGRRRFGRDAGGASAVEFAIVCFPFLLVVLYILQLGLFYMTQSALDIGVLRKAEELRNSFNAATAPPQPSASALKASIASYAGGLVANDATLSVEIQPLTNLAAAVTPISDGVANYGAATSVLVLRAQSAVATIAPSFSSLNKVTATSIVRRQGR